MSCGVPLARIRCCTSPVNTRSLWRFAPASVRSGGAGELLQEALKIAENRLAAGKVGVDVIPRSCLNRCHDAPMVMAMIEEGAVPLPRCGEEALLAALAEIDAMRAQP